MTATRDRLMELLADRALVGLGQREQIELAELLVQIQDVDIAAFDDAASAIALASLGTLEKMPSALAERVETAALEGPARPASDYMKTRPLDKLAPGLVRTQVDEILEPQSIDPASSDRMIEPEPESLDYKKTLTLAQDSSGRAAERGAERPGLLTQEPESFPTMERPNDPYVVKPKPIATTPRPFAPAPAPTPTPLVPARAAQSPAPAAQYPVAHAYPQPSPAPVPAYSHAPAPSLAPSSPSPSRPMPSSPSGANVVPLSSAPARGPSRAFAISGWILAAACLVLAIGAYARRTPNAPVAIVPPPTAPTSTTLTVPTPTPTTTAPPSAQLAALTPGELRDKLLTAEGTARAEWSPTKDPLGKSATGEVVWNKDQQKGIMRFRGLAKNDPSRAQYQLWIFDKTRDEKYPVDGGVFDVDSETGDVVVPIRATLAVNAPTLFAVTLEKPGGVVVSKRDRIVVTAKMPAG